jgi:endonuclease III
LAEKTGKGSSGRLKISYVLKQISTMVYGSKDSRATALAHLKESEGDDPFRILIGTIISQRNRDEVTTKAVERLFSRFHSASELSKARPEEVRRLIKPAVFYNVKSKSIVKVAKRIMSDFQGRVPQSIDDLLTLPSVGRKTANCVLVYGFDKPAIPVDTHVHRISNRLGLVHTETPEETEEELVRLVPKRYWLELNDHFVRFGQTICRPIGPRCHTCLLTGVCEYYKTVVEPAQKKA